MKVYPVLVSVLLAVAVGCASQSSATKTTEERQQIANITYFDLVNCNPPAHEVSSPLTPEALLGLLVAARPQVLECLADPKARGKARNIKFSVDTTATESGWEHRITHTDLTPEGEQCIKRTLDKLLDGWAKSVERPKGTPVTAHLEVEHVGGITPTVSFGANEASDLAGKIRLAEKDWCDCLEPWKDKAPYQLQAKITISQGNPNPDITFSPSTAPEAQTIQTCLREKLIGLHLTTASNQLTLPYPFIFVNSAITEDLPDAPPDLKFTQLEGVRSQVAADSAIKLGNRLVTWNTYDAAVKQYKAKPQYSLVRSLKEKCAALVKADEEWVKALERRADVEQKTADLAISLKAQNPQWAEVEAAARKAAQTIKNDVETATKAKAADSASCPKEHF
jgi:hypothetical protein